MGRPTKASINLAALHDNLEQLKALSNNSKVVAVVKANAYGNGAIEVSLSIEPKVDILAVAFLAEAIELRAAGIKKPILVLQGPHQEEDLYSKNLNDIIWVMHSRWQLDAFLAYKQAKPNETNGIWLKFDSGMHRLGLNIAEFSEILNVYNSLINENTVIMTHLASADEPNQTHAKQQITHFLSHLNHSKLPVCIANSATHVRFAHARKDFVRLGIAMYGSSPFQSHDNPIALRAVMSLDSSIIALRWIPKGDSVGYGATWIANRPSLIATVALGYADGYPRHAPTGTPAWCNGQLISLVGRVSMDMLTFDVTDLHQVEVGDTVQLWGDKLAINQVAEHVDTISYELMTRVSQRVPRDYIYGE